MPPIDLDPRFVRVGSPFLIGVHGILKCQMKPYRCVTFVKRGQKS